MRIAICDDVKEYNVHLHKMLDNYMTRNGIDSYEIKEYISGQTLLCDFSKGLFDFIFLDVQMPDLNGFDTAGHIRKSDPDTVIVFITHMQDNVQTGYDYSAKGYLYKDVNQNQIDGLMDRLLDEYNRRENVLTYPVKLKYDEGTAFLRLPDILYFESKDRYVLAVSIKETLKETFVFRGRLSEVAEDLRDKGFIRIHQSYLVNTAHIFKNFVKTIILSNGNELTVSKPYRSVVNDALKGVW